MTAPRSRGRKVAPKSRSGLWAALAGLGVAALLIILLIVLYGGTNGEAEVAKTPVITNNQPNALPTQATGAAQIGEKLPDEGQGHVPRTQRVTYKTNPPTSGSHWDTPADWGVYKAAPEDEPLVHSLEHGGVIISYNPDQISDEELAQIEALYDELSALNFRLIVTPRTGMDSKVVMTAWTYMLKLNSVDAAQIRAFYYGHIARGPECKDGACPR